MAAFQVIYQLAFAASVAHALSVEQVLGGPVQAVEVVVLVIEKVAGFLIGELGAFDGANRLIAGHVLRQPHVVLLGLVVGLVEAEKVAGEGRGAGDDLPKLRQ